VRVIIRTDASIEGRRAVIAQVIDDVEYPYAFHSQVHNATERRCPAHEQEFGAVTVETFQV
jgi:hypothetical protein